MQIVWDQFGCCLFQKGTTRENWGTSEKAFEAQTVHESAPISTNALKNTAEHLSFQTQTTSSLCIPVTSDGLQRIPTHIPDNGPRAILPARRVQCLTNNGLIIASQNVAVASVNFIPASLLLEKPRHFFKKHKRYDIQQVLTQFVSAMASNVCPNTRKHGLPYVVMCHLD